MGLKKKVSETRSGRRRPSNTLTLLGRAFARLPRNNLLGGERVDEVDKEALEEAEADAAGDSKHSCVLRKCLRSNGRKTPRVSLSS